METMRNVAEKPAAQAAIDELRAVATTPEDHAYLDSEQRAFESERAQTVGRITLPELVAGPGGAAVSKEDINAARNQGQEIFEDGNRRG